MAVQRYKLALNAARFPLISHQQSRAVVLPSLDASQRSSFRTQGAEENIDNDLAQIIYGENFVPVADGVKSVSYHQRIAPTANNDFDQIFPLRDAQENTVLYSPGAGQNYTFDRAIGIWQLNPMAGLLAAVLPTGYLVAENSTNTIAKAQVTRAYVDGKTLICYSKLGARKTTDPVGPATRDASLLYWTGATFLLVGGYGYPTADIVVNHGIPIGQIGGIASSNGYLLLWSGLTVYWAPFNGTAFDYAPYANGEVTGAGSQIPEDIQGPITAIIPVSGGYIIFTTKNAVAALYNANNFASPWIFKAISNAGGVNSFEQVASEGGLGIVYGYTTGGMQKISLNTSEGDFPDVTDFLGGRLLEFFNTSSLQFSEGQTTAELFVKLTQCGSRFLVISYGSFPGIFTYALIYDAELRRWGKLRLKHVDCFSYSYGSETANLTYAMMGDVTYAEMLAITYGTAQIQGGDLTYPRQSVAFLLKTGEVKVAVMDHRAPDDDSVAYVLLGKNQLTRARLSTLHTVEVEGLKAGGEVAVIRSVDGSNYYDSEVSTLREQTGEYSEWGVDNLTGKTFTLFVKGQFHLSTLILHASNDGSF